MNNNTYGTDTFDPFGALLIIGNRVVVIEEHEDGTLTREDHLWRDFWPSGTAFYDEHNVVAVKLGSLWISWAGEPLGDLTDAMNAPYRLVLNDDQIDELRERYKAARAALVGWRHLLAQMTIPADESGE